MRVFRYIRPMSTILYLSFYISTVYILLYTSYAVVIPLRKAASYEQRKTNLGSSP